MPELPEVESVRRALTPHLLNQTVLDVRLHRRDVLVLPGDPPGGFARQRRPADRVPASSRGVSAHLLKGLTFTRIDRRGKQLALVAATLDETPNAPDTHAERALGVHLGMSGHLEFIPAGGRLPDGPGRLHEHVHVTWRLPRGSLIFADPRRFGLLRALPTTAERDAFFAELGPDALAVTTDELAAGLRGSRRAIKAALLDQACVAGVGNIYADEALFLAGIRPTTTAGSLGPDAIERLARAIRETLEAALASGGSSIRDYRDANGHQGQYQLQHAVYGRGGEPCVKCGFTLSSCTVAQRTTVYCRKCQPERAVG